MLRLIFTFFLFKFGHCFLMTAKSDVVVQSCVSRVISSIFGSESTLYYVFQGERRDALPFDVVNPIVTFNVSNPIILTGTRREKQFVIQWDYFEDDVFGKMMKSELWVHRFMGTSVFLIITKDLKMLTDLFFYMWQRGLIYVALMITHENAALTTLHTAFPFGPNQEIQWEMQFCEDPQMRNTILKPIKNYNRFVSYLMEPSITTWENSRINKLATVSKRPALFLNQHVFGITPYDLFSLKISGVTKPHLRGEWVWMVPQPKQIVGPAIFIRRFEVEVWIGTVCAFLGLTFVLWLALRKSDVTKICLDVFLLTIFGLIDKMPTTAMLRYVILLYIIYSIHIQTAYISNLVPSLTLPQYEKGIRTIEDLANSKFPIYDTESETDRSDIIPANDTTSKKALRSRINQKIIYLKLDENMLFDMLKEWNNFSFKATSFRVEQFETVRNYTIPNTIIDNAFSGLIQISYTMLTARGEHYFLDTLNEMVDMLTESGIYQKHERDVDERLQDVARSRMIPHEPVALDLRHLYGLFIIYGFGLAISFIVLLGECVLGRLSP
ncbi:hypothetical protein PPYR_13949 [Photinus pyralis]|uniref:Ionotropic glutamate receptor C-terminal domain-containing protein n=1 Tax=Photinus pyralis TaxID=7054 RepID=A0A5N4A3W8_PHOPY|nr:uncharacterized protein LOC116180843 [Photinus pyralis]KAB0791988.1 hypothetical protein PPYR_13949 [Photinus pyralis]